MTRRELVEAWMRGVGVEATERNLRIVWRFLREESPGRQP